MASLQLIDTVNGSANARACEYVCGYAHIYPTVRKSGPTPFTGTDGVIQKRDLSVADSCVMPQHDLKYDHQAGRWRQTQKRRSTER